MPAPPHRPLVRRVASAAALAALVTGCAAPLPRAQKLMLPSPTREPRWETRQAVLEGFAGVTLLDTFEVDGGVAPRVDASSVDTVPLVGGGAQVKLGGGLVDLGVEGLVAFDWRPNAAAFESGGGGGVLAVDVDVLLVELCGGPFASVFLGDDWRLHAGAGPALFWASWDQDGGTVDDSGTGFGTGGYARLGLQYRWSDETFVGLGVRYVDANVDLSSGLGDLQLDGTQVYVTITRGF